MTAKRQRPRSTASTARRGFSLDETFAEYRALRASVMKHWTEAGIGSGQSEVQELIRFNEAVDQAIAESIREYAKAVARYRDMFLATCIERA